jgi:hypothetical protein
MGIKYPANGHLLLPGWARPTAGFPPASRIDFGGRFSRERHEEKCCKSPSSGAVGRYYASQMSSVIPRRSRARMTGLFENVQRK